ncbi:MAG: hypothetical protein GY838_08895 [bacterium]|nr:hypothetical protein [bacterium]
MTSHRQEHTSVCQVVRLSTNRFPFVEWTGSLLLLVVLTAVDVYLDRRGWLPIPSSVVAFGIIALLGFGTILYHKAVRESRPGVGKGILWLLTPMLLISALNLLSIWRAESYGGEGFKYYFLVVYNTLIYGAALYLGTSSWLRRSWRGIARFAIVTSTASIIWDLVAPGTIGTMMTRAAGLGYNANSAALQTVLPLAVALRYDRVRIADIFLIAVGILGAFATLSRGGSVMIGCVLVIYVYQTVIYPIVTQRASALRGLLVTVAAAAVILGGLTLVVGASSWFENASARRRIDILIGRSSFLNPEESRVRLAKEYIQLVAERPLVGHGAGYIRSQPRGPHNMFLRMWTELGILGCAAYLLWLASVLHLSMLRRETSGIVLSLLLVLASLVSHNLLEYRVLILFTGIEMGRYLVYVQHRAQGTEIPTGEDHATP